MTNLVKLDIESEPLGSEDGEIYETLSQKKAMEKQICPICMDDLEESTNRVNTECGHSFHTSCLMASVATAWLTDYQTSNTNIFYLGFFQATE